MVYQVFNNGIDRRQSLSSSHYYHPAKLHNGSKRNGERTGEKRRANSRLRKGRSLFDFLPNYLRIQTESRLVILFIIVVKITLFLYDLISLPIYYLQQLPGKQAREAQRTYSNQVDANTWVRNHNFQRQPILNRAKRNGQQQHKVLQPARNNPVTNKFLGSTLDEIFANAINTHENRSCLGYRAVVTCPVLMTNELGEHVMEEKSFRSDYTWYTFGQIGQRVQDIASGLYHKGVMPQSRAFFLASTSLEWFCTAQSSFQLDVQLVLASEINNCHVLKLIMEEAQVECLFVSCDKLRLLCQLIDSTLEVDVEGGCTSNQSSSFSLKQIIIIDWLFAIDFSERAFGPLGESLSKLHRNRNEPSIQVLSIGQIEEFGIENPIRLRCSPPSSLGVKQNSFDQQLTTKIACEKSDSATLLRRNLGAIDLEFNNEFFPSSRPCKSSVCIKSTKQSDLASSVAGLDASSNVNRKDHFLADVNNLMNHESSEIKIHCYRAASKPKDVAIINYTFGSLGQPKGIMLAHEQLISCLNDLYVDGIIGDQEVHCTAAPLDNIVELMVEMCILSHGGSIGYSCSLSTLFYDGKELFARDKSDLEALNPSFMFVRPYILERLKSSVQNYLESELNPLIGFIMKNVLYEYKKYWAKRHYSTPIVDRLFCSQLKRLFGSQIQYILCNGATDCSETKDFFAFMLDLPVVELYAPEETIVSLISVNDIWGYRHDKKKKKQTRAVSGYGWRLFQFDQYEDDDDDQLNDEDADQQEENGPEINEQQMNTHQANGQQKEKNKTKVSLEGNIERLLPPRVNRNIYRQNLSKNILMTPFVLCPTFGTRIRLEDWEDFRASDQPYPRGRMLVGGDAVGRGYFKPNWDTNLSDLDSSYFYTDSNFVNWFRTNDIARVFSNGSFEIISAISDLIKMVDDQFVSLSQIEHILRNSKFVDNVCAICGHDRTFVINLVVPNLRRLALKSSGEANLKALAIGTEPEPEELSDVEFRREVCNDRLLCEFVNGHLNELIAKSGLASLGMSFLLVPEIWTPQSELVTPAFEPKRAAIQKFYATDIQSIVRSMESQHNSKRLSDKRYKIRKSSAPNRLSVC